MVRSRSPRLVFAAALAALLLCAPPLAGGPKRAPAGAAAAAPGTAGPDALFEQAKAAASRAASEQDVDAAAEAFERAAAEYRTAGNVPREAECHGEAAGLFYGRKQYEKALQQYSKAKSIYKAHGMDAEQAGAHWYKALVLVDMGRLEEALVYLDEAAALFKAKAMAAELAGVLDTRIQTQVRLNRYAHAVKTCEQIEEIYKGGGREQDLADVLVVKGMLFGALKKEEQAQTQWAAAEHLFQATGSDEKLADLFLRRGEFSRSLGRLDEAIGFFDKARGIAAEKKNEAQVAAASAGKGAACLDAGRAALALQSLDVAALYYSSARQSADLSATLLRKAEALLKLGRHEDALAMVAAAEQTEYPGRREDFPAEMQVRRAAIHGAMGRPDDARAALDRAEDLYKALSMSEPLARVYVERAALQRKTGLIEQAIADYKRARVHYFAAGRPDMVASLNVKLGGIYHETGRDPQALAVYEKAVAWYERQRAAEPLAEVRLVVAEVHAALQQYDEAMDHLAKAEKHFAAKGAADRVSAIYVTRAEIQMRKAALVLKSNRPDEALALYDKAETVFRALNRDPTLAVIYHGKALALLAKNAPTDALLQWNKAEKIFSDNRQRERLAEVARGKARLFESIGRLNDAALQHARSDALCKEAMETGPLPVGVHLALVDDRMTFYARHRSFGSDREEGAAALGRSGEILREAWAAGGENAVVDAIEKVRALGARLEAIAIEGKADAEAFAHRMRVRDAVRGAALTYRGAPFVPAERLAPVTDLWAKRAALYAETAGWWAKRAGVKDPQERAAARAQLAAKFAEIDAVEKELGAKSRLYRVTFGSSVAAVDAVRLRLTNGTALLSYDVSPEGIRVFVADRERSRLVTLGGPGTELMVERQVRAMRAEMAGWPASLEPDGKTKKKIQPGRVIYSYGTLQQILTPLSQLLLDYGALVRGKTRLLIAPDGPLHALPFELLENDGRPLGEQLEVVYVGHLPALAEEPAAKGEGYLGFGGADFDLGADPNAEGGCRSACGWTAVAASKEIAAAAGAPFKGTVRAGADATVKGLAAGVPGMRVVHLVTRARFGACPGAETAAGAGRALEIPWGGATVALAGANACGGREPGVFGALEVLAIDFGSVDLVALSEPGSVIAPDADPGPGTGALRRAFTAAGASYFVQGMWPVKDADLKKTALSLMKKVQGGKTPLAAVGELRAESIAAARKAYKVPHPYFWTPYVVAAGPEALK